MNFEKAKATYRKNAYIQKQMAENLIRILIKFFGNKFDSIFEIGAGTGFLTDEIKEKLLFKKIILNDLTDNFTNFLPDSYIKGDIIKVEIPLNLDLILSNAVFQWIEDYGLLFKKLHKSLKKGGVLAFSYFGENNFAQIKNITKIGLDYPKPDEIIKQSGFEILYFEEELKTLYFKDIKELLNHIKFTGVKTENKIWTKSDFKNFEEKYLSNYKDELGFELTYHPVYYLLKAL